MVLKKFSELGTVHRTEPCKEYPGEWLVCIPESLGPQWNRWWFSQERPTLGHSFQTFDEALKIGKSFLTYLEDQRAVYNAANISVCWKCTDNDPRIGECWFTSFYMHGRFNVFGDYKPT